MIDSITLGELLGNSSRFIQTNVHSCKLWFSLPPHFAKSGGSRRRMVCGIIGGEKEIRMGLVKTRRLAAMHKQQRAKAKMQAQKKSFAAKPRDPRSAAR